ncbi:MAG: hypothetical protein ABIJ46_05165 [bacterium]
MNEDRIEGSHCDEIEAILAALELARQMAWLIGGHDDDLETVMLAAQAAPAGEGDQPDRIDRLRALGNGVVPAQAALAFDTLVRELFG